MESIKLVLVICVLGLFLGATLGIPVANQMASSNYYYTTAVALAIVLNQNTQNTQTTENMTDLKQIENRINQIQSEINTGFAKWADKNPTAQISILSKPDEKQAWSLLLQFLDKNPEYKILFMEQDRLQTQRNDILAQQTLPSMNYTLFMEKGELIAEWNTTSTVNGTTFTYVCKQYRMEINGTTQMALKVWVYSSDGTLITDPSCYFTAYPLWYVWTWWYWTFWVNYGTDYYWYNHYNKYEARYMIDQMKWFALQKVLLFSSVDLLLILLDIIPFVDLVSVPVHIFWILVSQADTIKTEAAINVYENVLAHNNKWPGNGDMGWGLRTYEKLHQLWGVQPWWDLVSYYECGAVTYEGGTVTAWVNVATVYDLGNLANQWMYYAGVLGCWGQWAGYSLPPE